MNSKHQSTAPADKQMEAESAGQAAAVQTPVVPAVNVVVPVTVPVSGAKAVVDLEAKARADKLREEDKVRAPNPATNQPVAAVT